MATRSGTIEIECGKRGEDRRSFTLQAKNGWPLSHAALRNSKYGSLDPGVVGLLPISPPRWSGDGCAHDWVLDPPLHQRIATNRTDCRAGVNSLAMGKCDYFLGGCFDVDRALVYYAVALERRNAATANGTTAQRTTAGAAADSVAVLLLQNRQVVIRQLENDESHCGGIGWAVIRIAPTAAARSTPTEEFVPDGGKPGSPVFFAGSPHGESGIILAIPEVLRRNLPR